LQEDSLVAPVDRASHRQVKRRALRPARHVEQKRGMDQWPPPTPVSCCGGRREIRSRPHPQLHGALHHCHRLAADASWGVHQTCGGRRGQARAGCGSSFRRDGEAPGRRPDHRLLRRRTTPVSARGMRPILRDWQLILSRSRDRQFHRSAGRARFRRPLLRRRHSVPRAGLSNAVRRAAV
jgi:hypothetical protein